MKKGRAARDARHAWGVAYMKPRGTERSREACRRCGCIRLVTAGGHTRYYLPGRNPVVRYAPRCSPDATQAGLTHVTQP